MADPLAKRLLVFGVVITAVLFSLAYIQINPRDKYVETGDTLYPYSYSSGQIEYDRDAEKVNIKVSIETDREFDVYLYKGTGFSPFMGAFPPPQIRHGVANGEDIAWELDREELNGSDISLLLENLHWGDVAEDDTSIHYSMETVVVSHLDPLTVPMFWIAFTLVLAYFTLAVVVHRRTPRGRGSDQQSADSMDLDDKEDLKVLDQP